MNVRRLARLGAVLALAVTATAATIAPASAHQRHVPAPLGTASLAALLATDGSGFDRNPNDYDVLDAAVTAVLAAKPDSPVAVLADGNTPLTAFLPTDRAFQRLATDLTGKRYRSEQQVFTAVAGLGIDTVESVLLYHVVPGATITYRQARRSDGAALTTALGSSVTVDVRRCGSRISLVDADPDAADPVVVRANLNEGNRQIAHGINRVLRPVDL